MSLVKPTDHKLHVRVPTLNKHYHHKMLEACRTIGVTVSSVTENYTNFYVYVPNTVNRDIAQSVMTKLLSKILILV